MMLRIYLVTWRVWARKEWLTPGLPGYIKSMGKERMTNPWFTWVHESMGKERMTAPWFTWVNEEYGQGKDDCPLVFLVTWRVWARKGWLPLVYLGTWRVWARKGLLSPGLPGYMKSMIKERMSAPCFTWWLHEEYEQGKDACLLVYLVTWRVKSRKGCLPPGLSGYMKSKIKERMPVSWFNWLHEE